MKEFYPCLNNSLQKLGAHVAGQQMPLLKKCETLKRTHLWRVTLPSPAKVAAQLFIQIKEQVFII